MLALDAEWGGDSLSRYLEIAFRSKLRLIVLVVLLPVALSGLNFYLWRSYDSVEVVYIDDPQIFGQGMGSQLGFNPYETVGQNYAQVFSNQLGTQSFNNAMIDSLTAQGTAQSDLERKALLASLTGLTLTPGGSTLGSGAVAAIAADHAITFHYVCTKEVICATVLATVLPVFRSQYADLKSQAAAKARTVYEPMLKDAEARHAAAVAAVQHYLATKPANDHGTQQSDPVLTALQAEIADAQKDIDLAQGQLQHVDTITQIANTIASDLHVVDGPRTLPGLYGIKGFRNDNLKTDAIVFIGCLLAAAAYLVLVGFLDRTVRDPGQLKALGRPVITIPDYQAQASRRGKATAPT